MKRPRSDRVILFDLGGVLVENTGEQGLSSLLPYQLGRQELWARWLASDAVRRFECGQIPPEVFAARFPEWRGLLGAAILARSASVGEIDNIGQCWYSTLRGGTMKTVTLDVRKPAASMGDFLHGWKTGKPQKSARISFATPELLWQVLTGRQPAASSAT